MKYGKVFALIFSLGLTVISESFEVPPVTMEASEVNISRTVKLIIPEKIQDVIKEINELRIDRDQLLIEREGCEFESVQFNELTNKSKVLSEKIRTLYHFLFKDLDQIESGKSFESRLSKIVLDLFRKQTRNSHLQEALFNSTIVIPEYTSMNFSQLERALALNSELQEHFLNRLDKKTDEIIQKSNHLKSFLSEQEKNALEIFAVQKRIMEKDETGKELLKEFEDYKSKHGESCDCTVIPVIFKNKFQAFCSDKRTSTYKSLLVQKRLIEDRMLTLKFALLNNDIEYLYLKSLRDQMVLDKSLLIFMKYNKLD